MLVASAPDRKLRCGVICGKKFSKKAVVRNRARRIFWESFRMLKPEIKPCHVIVIPRMRIQGMRTQDIIPDLSRLLEKAGLTGN
jgi:ribonuclease P protein component